MLGIASDFTKFKELLRDIVRGMFMRTCDLSLLTIPLVHRLLWVIGIAHGDVSFHNIMFNPRTKVAVLNDFDLASIMAPGAPSPPRAGHTGTPLFMALELLSDEAKPRFYRHDLESFAWVLFYASICVQDGRENLDVKPIRDWLMLRSPQLRDAKIGFLFGFQRNIYVEKWLIPTLKFWFHKWTED